MASVDLSYSGFLHLLLLCHPISIFPPLPALTVSSSQPFLAARQLWGRSSFLLESSISSTLELPLTYPSTRQTLPRFSNFLQTIPNYYWNRFIKIFNPLPTSLRNYPPPHLLSKLLFSKAPTRLHSPHPSPEESPFNYLPLPLNTIQNRSHSRYSRTPPFSTLGFIHSSYKAPEITSQGPSK